MGTVPSPDWDPRAPDVLDDQRQAYDELRERCPVAHSELLAWSIFRHEDIAQILADPETYSNATARGAIPNGMDPPEHTLYRRALQPFFAGSEMTAFETRCRQIAADTARLLLTPDTSEVECISAFAEPFAAKALCAYLGWPDSSWERLAAWNRGNQEVALRRDRQRGKELALAFTGFVVEELRAHREAGKETSGDVTARLMALEVAGEPLSDEDIVSALRNWIAGHSTVTAALGIVLHYLAEHEDLQQELRDAPELLPAAIDEILRSDGPLVANQRTTTREVEIRGRQIGAGEKLTLMWIAANRDGRVFDDPETVRFDRVQAADSFVFGAGIHDCVGAPLARLELRIAVEELLRGTSLIELGETPALRSTYPSNGFETLSLRLS